MTAATMLTHVPGTVPSEADLEAAERRLLEAKTAVESLAMNLEHLEPQGELRLTPEQAWFLTFSARGFKTTGEELVELAEKIESAVEGIYLHTLDERARRAA